jgi:hypothetical protein
MNKQRVLLIAVVLIGIEFLLPVPGPLTLCSIYVLAARPRWFREAVDLLYSG